ncbi:RNA polymerase Rpc34 [Coniochaeta ligniaria NRRL 30616]|uniref:DNA-directed RNA polymerase III subunit RPC6 n=1 Tax=Coniochaeta ligniaria NRRL 30616 TaxID=1408157 RepID=A0A1J7I8V6_9PEZI|nr:RNA polymerase Rpc34 [Coniochaeta ligniaria NRRL 30616]
MASRAAGEDTPKVEILKDALYEEMTQHGSSDRLYNQNDLINLNIIPKNDLSLLLKVVQGLCDDRLLIATSDNRMGIAWRYRSREDAKKYTSLPNNETAMVYELIDEAGGDGIWSRTLKGRLKIHESVLKTCIKYLETKGYITDMKSVEHPNKKMYIKANLRPSDRATGGPWYTDSNLDEAFITGLERIIFNFIRMKSAHFREGATKVPKKGVAGGAGAAARGKKRAATEMSEEGTPAAAPAPTAHGAPGRRQSSYLPFPAGYNYYPTAHEIAEFISISGITNNTTLSEDDVQQLVDILCYDGLIEPVVVGRRRGYRTARISRLEPDDAAKLKEEEESGEESRLGPPPVSNGFVEAPCGRCPVFELCEEGGPVNPSNCVYFQRWLGLE